MSAPATIPRSEIDDSQKGYGGWIVTAYNNEHNTYEEVILILMAATKCPPDEAAIETWEIDHLGKSVVHQACEAECQGVADVITSIGLHTEVSEA